MACEGFVDKGKGMWCCQDGGGSIGRLFELGHGLNQGGGAWDGGPRGTQQGALLSPQARFYLFIHFASRAIKLPHDGHLQDPRASAV